MRIACVLITHLIAKAELQRYIHLKDRPMAVVAKTSGKPLVVDSSSEAYIRAGMTMEEAMPCHNDLIILDGDESHYRRVFEEVAESLLSVSDGVELAELGVAYVRVDALELLYGGEEKVIDALLGALPAYLRARVGVGDAKFTSRIAAQGAEALGSSVCPSDAAGFVAPLSIDLLPLSSAMRKALHHFGVHCMGQAAALSRDALTDRFGPEGTLA